MIRQYPAAGASMNPGQRVYLLTEESSKMKVPDLTGESLRDAMEVLSLMKVGVTVKGEGYVVEQKEQVAGEQRTVQLTLQSAKAAVTGIEDEAPESSGTPTSSENDDASDSEQADQEKETQMETTDSSQTENGDAASDSQSTDTSLP